MHHSRSVGWIGVVVGDVSYRLAEQIGLDSSHGAVISAVVSQAPADEAGLEVGDVIVALDGHELEDAAALRREVGEHPCCAMVVKIYRGKDERVLSMTVGELAA